MEPKHEDHGDRREHFRSSQPPPLRSVAVYKVLSEGHFELPRFEAASMSHQARVDVPI